MIQASVINPNYYYPDDYEDMASKFLEAYDVIYQGGCPNAIPENLKPRNERICRFCGSKSPLVSFYNDAHLLPAFLGNIYWISDYECDQCNSKFSKYENDLANFVGATRTVQSHPNKRGPKYKSPDKKLEIETVRDSADESTVLFKRFDSKDATFHFNKETNTTTISYVRIPYIPLHVFKSFLKMALAVIPAPYLRDFKHTFEYLTSTRHDEKFGGFEVVTAFIMPLTFNIETPAVLLFKKKDPGANLFSYIFVIHTLNYIYQISIPFTLSDRALFAKPNSVITYWCPPLFGRPSLDGLPIESKSFHLGSKEKVYNERETISFPNQPVDLQRSVFKNEITGEFYEEPFDSSKISGIHLKLTKID